MRAGLLENRGAGFVVLLIVAHGGLLAIHDLGRRPFVTLFLLAIAFLAFWGAARHFEKRAAPALVLGVALVLRLLLLPLPPTLSDDILRYVWDGKLVSAGFNPYRWAPEAPELAELRDPLWERMPHKDVPAVYPPLALSLFTAGAHFPNPLIGVKILLTIAELAACWLVLRLAIVLGLPAGRAVWYAWNPLAALEVAGMGHVDGLLAATVLTAALFLVVRPPRPFAAGAAAAAGVLTKLVPLMALPFWARHAANAGSRRALPFLLTAGLLVTAAMLPIIVALGGAPPGLLKYGISWEFNGPLYEPLWRVFDQIDLDESVKSALDQIKTLTGRHDFWNRLYPFVYPQFMAKMALLGLFSLLLLRAWRRDAAADPRSVVTTSGRVFGAVVLCSATLYPWYLLWVLPWAALAKQRAWLVLGATLPVAYLPQLVGWPLFPWIWLAVWAPFFIFLAMDSSWSID